MLRDVDLDVPAGSIVALVGANGAGKTTLLRTLSGLVPLTRGSIRLDGQDLAGVSVEDRVRRGLAHVPEGRGVVAELTVDENLRLGGAVAAGRTGRAAVDEVYELFEPLARRRDNAGHQLSGGERQMLALGRALVARPTVLLLDEPSLGLAPRVVAQIMGVLRGLADRTGLTVLLAEQNVVGALSVADHGVVLGLGEVVASAARRTSSPPTTASATPTWGSDGPTRLPPGHRPGARCRPRAVRPRARAHLARRARRQLRAGRHGGGQHVRRVRGDVADRQLLARVCWPRCSPAGCSGSPSSAGSCGSRRRPRRCPASSWPSGW